MAMVDYAPDEWLEDIRNELAQDLDKALDFISSEFDDSRARAQRYFNGESDLPADANRSRYVATLVRDSMRAIKPSLMRVFVSSWYPVEFIPQTVAQGMIAEAQTEWAAQLFEDLGGYLTIYSAFHDAMLHKLGVVKYYYDDKIDPIYRSYTGLSEQEVQLLNSHPLVDVMSAEAVQIPGPQGMLQIYDVEVVGNRPAGEIEMKWCPLNEFLINRNATCKEDARVIAHRRNVIRGDLTAMGFDPEVTAELNSDEAEVSHFADESYAKRGYTIYPTDDDTVDESMQEVLLTEAYYRADLDGTGVPQLYRFWLGGTDYKLLEYERVTEVPFAFFAIDPVPGTIFGKSIYDLTENDQDVMTSLTRATVDNFHMNNNPRLAVHEHMVNMEDVLNNDLGSPIRVRAAGQIQAINTPFTGAAALPLLQRLDQKSEEKVGMTKAASGLDPDALQSTDKEAVQNTIKLSQGQIELMARNLAETGMKDLFHGLLRLGMQHLDANQILRKASGNEPVRIDVFDPKMKLRAAVGTGTGSSEERNAALNEIVMVQEKMMDKFGPGNPFVTLQNMQAAMDDKLKLAGLYNPRKYFGQVTPEKEKAFVEQFQKSQKEKTEAQKQIASTQAGALQEAEKIKAEAKVFTDTQRTQLDMQKAVQSGQIDAAQLKQKEDASMRELLVKDDLARDEMIQNLYIEMAKLREDFAKANMTVSTQQGAANG